MGLSISLSFLLHLLFVSYAAMYAKGMDLRLCKRSLTTSISKNDIYSEAL
jgi:hypothetical protein